jgi:hypothetical protein
VHLEAVDGVFILGSTEPHYTPSKVYQGVLSGKPILAVLHRESTAVTVIRAANTGVVLDFDGENGLGSIEKEFLPVFREFRNFMTNYDVREVDTAAFDGYSAKNVTATLAGLLNKCIQTK